MGQPGGDGVPLFYTSIVMLALAWPTCIARVGVRVWRKAVGLDDILMFIGLLLFSVTACLCIVCTFFGSGQFAVAIDSKDNAKGIKLFFIAEFFYASSAAIIKCSIATTILRIADTRKRFVYSIWVIQGASIIAAIVFISGVANICHPINTLWGESQGTCNLQLNSDVSFFFSAIEIATDFSLAILPAVLLWNIQMRPKVKISVALILGLAAFASCATIVRLNFLTLYDNPQEFMYSTGKIGLWSIIEEGIGIFAGSLPALRPLLNLPFFSNGSSAGESEGPNSGSHFNQARSRASRRKVMRSDVAMDTFQELGDKEEGDGDSQKHILKETHVTVENSSAVNGTTAKPADWERSQVLGWKENQYGK